MRVKSSLPRYRLASGRPRPPLPPSTAKVNEEISGTTADIQHATYRLGVGAQKLLNRAEGPQQGVNPAQIFVELLQQRVRDIRRIHHFGFERPSHRGNTSRGETNMGETNMGETNMGETNMGETIALLTTRKPQRPNALMEVRALNTKSPGR